MQFWLRLDTDYGLIDKCFFRVTRLYIAKHTTLFFKVLGKIIIKMEKKEKLYTNVYALSPFFSTEKS